MTSYFHDRGYRDSQAKVRLERTGPDSACLTVSLPDSAYCLHQRSSDGLWACIARLPRRWRVACDANGTRRTGHCAGHAHAWLERV